MNIDTLSVIRAANYTHGRSSRINLVGIHVPSGGILNEGPNSGEGVAQFFARGGSGVGSAHLCSDGDSAVRCVDDGDTAWGASGSNTRGLHIEIFGSADQSPQEWQDDYSQRALRIAADLVRQWCDRYGVPKRRLSRDEVNAGAAGIAGHNEMGGGHYDPGPAFPWDQFIELVNGGSSEEDELMAALDTIGKWLQDSRKHTEATVTEAKRELRGQINDNEKKIDALTAKVDALAEKLN